MLPFTTVALPLASPAMSTTPISCPAAMMTVESLAFADADPPPDTLTELICGDAAFWATFTVTVIGV